ncbi:MAG TPA: cytochrome c [Gemmatimonadales bacterium]
MRKVLVACLLLGLVACNPDDVVHQIGWFATMRHQRGYKPYARPIAPVDGTVPVTGWEQPVDLNATPRLANPRAKTAESINRGRFVYETYCLVCHGPAGKGDGPVSMLAGGPYPGVRPLVGATADKLADGYIFGVIVNATAMGRGLMPRYGDKVRGNDRWDVVNYVRTLQLQARGGSQ